MKIFLLMSGSLRMIEELADSDWRVYTALYIVFYNPSISPKEVFIIARQYTYKHKLKLTVQEVMEQLLLNLDFYQVYKYSSQYVEAPVISAIGLIAN